MLTPPARRYGRADLETLKTFDRSRVFQTLGSFDDRNMTEERFIRRAVALLDAGRIPGLGAAVEADDPAAILDAVSRAYPPDPEPDENASLSAQDRQSAEHILEHRFCFYGETHRLPADIDWDSNPGTAHWSHDLNRFSYLHPLTRAFLATGDTRFSRKAVDLILDWIAKCDFGHAFIGTPYAFGSYLNQAIHCEAWAECLRKLLPRGQVQPLEYLRILKSFHDHLAYLEIVTNGHAGNWPVIGCRGMLAALAAFPVFKAAGRLADYALWTLGAQIADQVLPDGVQDELTPHYHYVVANRLIGAQRFARALGRSLDEGTLKTLKKMVRYIQQTIIPDGSAQAAFNDSDPAAVPSIEDELAQAGLQGYLAPPETLGPERYPYAGVAFLRQRPGDGDLYLAFDGGPYGRSHQHEDKLGFWLFAYGRSFLVDPGRHLYDWSAVSYYDYLKTTRAHSTFLIDRQGQHSRGRPDTWIPEAPSLSAWSVEEGEIRAAAAYDLGYGEDNRIDVAHHREVVFVRERFWVIFDRVTGRGAHHVEARFQFAPGELRLEGARATTTFADANLLLWPLPSAPFTEVRVECGQENPRGGWYSRRYGEIEPAPCLSLSVSTPLPFSCATLLFPYRGGDPPRVSCERADRGVVVRGEEIGEIRVRPGAGG